MGPPRGPVGPGRAAAAALLSLYLAIPTLASKPSPLSAQAPDPGPPGALLLDGVTVVDVEEGRLIPDRRIVIRGETIAAVQDRSAPPPTDIALTVHGAGLFVIPGLVDHHVHLTPGSEEALRRALRGGVTLVQVMAGDNRAVGALQQAVLAGELEGPDIAYASVMAGPDFFEDPRFRSAGLGYPPGEAPWVSAVTAETDQALVVAAARGSGAEVLKLYAMMDPELVRGLTREAHRQGMRVVAHATVFPTRPLELAEAGVDVLTHAPYLSWHGAPEVEARDAWRRRDGPYPDVAPDGAAMAAVLQVMAARGTWLEPTFFVFSRSPDFEEGLAWSQEVVRAAHAAGVPILAGTDGMIAPAPARLPNLHQEMAELVRAGLTPSQALAAATVNPARAMGRSATHGAVAPGRVADLVLLSGNPLEEIEATTRIRYVVKRGRLLQGPP